MKSHTKFVLVYVPVIAGVILWSQFGRHLVDDAYQGKSWDFLNRVISGQASHSADYYFRLADRLVWHIGGIALLLLVLLHVLVVVNSLYQHRRIGLQGVCSVGIGCLSSFFFPPLFSRLFALGVLRDEEEIGLWLAFAFILLAAVFVHFAAMAKSHRIAALGFAAVLLIAAEFSVRAWAKLSVVRETDLCRIAEQTYPDTMRYRIHPLLHYTGTSRTALNDSGLSNVDDLPRRYNSLGFIGDEFTYRKSDGLLRIACLGGSTTESGYPQRLKGYLETRLPSREIDVLNFGLAAYSSVHSLLNYVLLVRDFAPDVVVIHDGWNDGIQRPISGANRGDYSLAYGPFAPRTPHDRWLIRSSVIYRWLRHKVNPRPDHIMLEGAMAAEPARIPPKELQNEVDRPIHGWTPFERNLRTIIELCRIDRRLCVLATMPHRTMGQDNETRDVMAMKANNETLRRLAKEFEGTVLIADLDLDMTGQNELFTDVGHVTGDGDAKKGVGVGDVIIDWLAADREATQVRRTR